MEFKKTTFSERPDLIAYEGEQVRINFDVEEKEIENDNNESKDEKQPQTVYEAYVVRVAHPVTRDRVIDAIVTEAYPADVMQAIINNHIMEVESDEHKAEFNAMQEWRSHAKEIATSVVESMQR